MTKVTYLFSDEAREPYEVWTGRCRLPKIGDKLAIWDADEFTYLPGEVNDIQHLDDVTEIYMEGIDEADSDMPHIRFEQVTTPEERLEKLRTTNSRLNMRVNAAEGKIRHQESTINALTFALNQLQNAGV